MAWHKKRRINKLSLIGFIHAMAGICIMLDRSVSKATYAVILSLIAGVTVVLSRTVNACLSEKTGPLPGSLINHLVGFPICVILVIIFRQPVTAAYISVSPLIYLGGVLGVITVLLFNITVPHVPSFRLTLLTFTGQVFTGIALDILLGAGYSSYTFTGGLVISAGLLLNMIAEKICACHDIRDISR